MLKLTLKMAGLLSAALFSPIAIAWLVTIAFHHAPGMLPSAPYALAAFALMLALPCASLLWLVPMRGVARAVVLLLSLAWSVPLGIYSSIIFGCLLYAACP